MMYILKFTKRFEDLDRFEGSESERYFGPFENLKLAKLARTKLRRKLRGEYQILPLEAFLSEV
jgi:hypothetical protein